ncbi:hypothetical protein EN795_33970 [bacterium M00.F.Ca.ET.152.01.1.1]|nr:hypothetical protein EN795_33970 [bacterium M00.F.Ca.ET.152.01.1.1]
MTAAAIMPWPMKMKAPRPVFRGLGDHVTLHRGISSKPERKYAAQSAIGERSGWCISPRATHLDALLVAAAVAGKSEHTVRGKLRNLAETNLGDHLVKTGK